MFARRASKRLPSLQRASSRGDQMTTYPIAHSKMSGESVSTTNTTSRRARGKVKTKCSLSEALTWRAFLPVRRLFFLAAILSAQMGVGSCARSAAGLIGGERVESGDGGAADASWPEWVYDEDPDIKSMEALVGHRVRHRRAQRRTAEEKITNTMPMDQPRPTREAGVKSGCEFPLAWSGEWFSKGERNTFRINSTSLGLKGMCFQKIQHPRQERYMLYQKQEHCYKCLVVFDRHPNVLQVKEGLCTPPEKGPSGETVPKAETLCQLIAPNSPVQTLVRVDGETIDCPFKGGDFTFTYRTGQSVCNNPRSYLDACVSEDMVAFRFQDCPDRQSDKSGSRDLLIAKFILEQRETGVETLTCMANWTESNRQYLVGMLEEPYKLTLSDKIRCFVYNVDQKGDIHIGQSREATCDGLRRIADGERTIKMRNDKKRSEMTTIPIMPGQNPDPTGSIVGDAAIAAQTPTPSPPRPDAPDCRFPSWAVDAVYFQSFTLNSQYNFTEDGVTMIVSNFTYLTNATHLISKTVCVDILEPVDTTELEVANAEVDPNVMAEKTRAFWDRVDMVKMVTKVTSGCTTKFKCLTIYRRHENIIEIQEGTLADDERSACMRLFMNEKYMTFTTLIKVDLEDMPCTANGMHNVTSLEYSGETDACAASGGFHEVSLRCGDEDDSEVKIKFFRRCKPGQDRISEFFCMGGWEEQIPYESLPPKPTKAPASSPASDYASGGGSFNNFYDSGATGYDVNGYNQGYNSPRDGSGQPTEVTDDDFGSEIPENITIGYLVARPKGQTPKSPKRVCFIYAYVNETYSWTVDLTSCRRNIRPGHEGPFNFQSVKTLACGSSALGSLVALNVLPLAMLALDYGALAGLASRIASRLSK